MPVDLNELSTEELIEVGHILADQLGFEKVAEEESQDLNELSVEDFLDFVSILEFGLEKQAGFFKEVINRAGHAAETVLHGVPRPPEKKPVEDVIDAIKGKLGKEHQRKAIGAAAVPAVAGVGAGLIGGSALSRSGGNS